MYQRVFIALLLSASSGLLWADGLYLQTLKKITVTEEQKQKSQDILEKHKEIKVRGELEVPPFHKRAKVTDSLGNSFCTTCHQSPPHTKSVRSRTFMNMHTQYIACETCHFRPESQQLSYQWQNTEDISIVPAEPSLFRQVLEPKKDDRGGELKEGARSQNTLVKITPYYQQVFVGLRKTDAFAKETKAIWQQKGITAEKVARRALIHAPLSEKGPKCDACHNDKETLFDVSKLGATNYQADKIQNNIVTQFFSRFKEEEQRIRIMSLLK